MDVDDENFEDYVNNVQEYLANAKFVSIDLEMTGIHGPGSAEEEGDTPEVRYQKAKKVAESYGIMQLGLCCFLACDAGGYQSFPYNFYLFPKPINEPPFFHSVRFSLDADAMNFNRLHNFDFSRWQRSGITYCNREVEAALKEADAFFEHFGGGDDVGGKQLADEAHKTLYSKKMEWFFLGCFKVDSEVLRTAMGIIKHSGSFKNVVIEKHDGPLGGSRYPRVYVRKIRLAEKDPSTWHASLRFDVHLGFRRVWKMLGVLDKPLILHNGLFDLLFLFHHFEAPLPNSYADFCAMVATTWPKVQVFDSKLLCECEFAREEMGFESSGLSTVFKAILRCDARETDVWQYEKYVHRPCPHEAGYDAMCTGIVYRFFEQVAHDSVLKAQNRIHIWGDYDFGVKSPEFFKTLKCEKKSPRVLSAPSPVINSGPVSTLTSPIFSGQKEVDV